MMHSNAKTHLQQSAFRNLFIREPSSTRTLSMAAGQLIPLYKKPENNSLECGLSQEPSNLWIKRLRSHPSDTLPSSSKRLKTSENEYKAQARNLLGIILNIDSSNHYFSKCLEGRQELKSTLLLTKGGECAYEESKAMNNWIQRWCRGSRQATLLRKAAPVLCEPERTAAPVLCEPERSNVMAAPLRKIAPVLCEPVKSSVMAAPLRKVEVAPVLCEPERSCVMPKALGRKRLPSIAAMALMGAVMKSSKTCRYKKKGSLLLWNI